MKEPEPAENERGPAFPIREASTFTQNPNSLAAVNRAGFGIEDGRLVPICDGRLETDFDEPEVAEAAMLPSEILTRKIMIACWDRLTGRDSRSFTEIAGALGVTRAAVSRCWLHVLQRSGMARIYRNAAARAKSAKLSARTRDYHARAKKGKVAK